MQLDIGQFKYITMYNKVLQYKILSYFVELFKNLAVAKTCSIIILMKTVL